MGKGILVKGYGGFYYVNVDGRIIECTLRGIFRLKKQDFLPGDVVKITLLPDGKGVIEDLLPRKNVLVRPPVANVDQVVIVTALKEPEPQLALLDRLLVTAEALELDVVICFNKVDKVQQLPEIVQLYTEIGYRAIATSVVTGQNIAELTRLLAGKISVFAGQSGVGKSSLLNAIRPDLTLKVGAVSDKIKRGRHTTRHVELLSLPGGGMVADTPGFSNLSLTKIQPSFLPYCFPEIRRVQADCRFSQCLHRKEPDCAVKKQLEAGLIAASRYDNYLTFLAELEREKRRN